MIDKLFVYDNVLPLIKEKGRMLEYFMVMNIFENKETEIVNELTKFQNSDGGFGNGLESDVRMPNSSVLATSKAIQILNELKDEKLKIELIGKIVQYLEEVYDDKNERFNMVTKEVDDFPHAVWWNFKDLDKNFPFGNPDPEIIGFLFKYRKYVKKLNLNHLINNVVKYIFDDKFIESGFHALLSVLRFNKLVDSDVQNLIHDKLHQLVDKEVLEGAGNWSEYTLEPYKVYVVDSHFIGNHKQLLTDNLQINLAKVKDLTLMPNWDWYQYNEVFEIIRYEWMGHLYFEIIKALRYNREK